MAGFTLSSVIDKSFVLRLAGTAQKGTSASSLARALQGGASQTSLSSGLRFGAQTYATAIQGLNATISYMNISRGTLLELSQLTDKLITVTERAASSSTSIQARRELDTEFKRLGAEFQRIVENADVGGREVLTVEGIKEIFETVGLDEKTSQSIAEIFERFVTPEDDETLASEEVKGSRPVKISPSAFTTKGVSSVGYHLEQITNSAIQTGFVTKPTAPYEDVDTILNINPTVQSLLVKNPDGGDDGLSTTLISSIDVLAVNETDGSSIIASTNNFLGYNSDNINQLFLVDSGGNVVHQLTNESGASNVFYDSADISSDDRTIAITLTDPNSTTNRYKVYKVSVTGSFGADPATANSTTTVATANSLAPDNFNGIKISNSGSYIAYLNTSGRVSFRNAALTEDAFLVADATATDYGFFADGSLEVLRSGNSTAGYAYGDGVYQTGISGFSISDIEGLESGTGYFSVRDTTNNRIRVYQITGLAPTLHTSYNLGGGDTYVSMNMSLSDEGNVDVGVVGNIPSLNADSDRELYKLTTDPQTSTIQSLRKNVEYNSIFDSARSIRTRPEALTMLEDLNALKTQISDNLDALTYATEIIGKNIDLVRATGLALLEITDKLTGEEEADEVARKVRDEVRKNAGAAISQAENLENILLAALTISSDTFTNK